MKNQKSLYDILVEDLRYREENDLRTKKYTGYHSQNYDSYIGITLSGQVIQDNRKRASITISIINDAFECGYDISTYLDQFKKFCKDNKL